MRSGFGHERISLPNELTLINNTLITITRKAITYDSVL